MDSPFEEQLQLGFHGVCAGFHHHKAALRHGFQFVRRHERALHHLQRLRVIIPSHRLASGTGLHIRINSSYAIYHILNEQKKAGVGILFVGEDLDVMMALCDKIMVLCHGRVMGVVHAHKTTKEELGLMMTGALDLTNKYEDKPAGYAKDTNITAQELEELERKKGEEE